MLFTQDNLYDFWRHLEAIKRAEATIQLAEERAKTAESEARDAGKERVALIMLSLDEIESPPQKRTKTQRAAASELSRLND